MDALMLKEQLDKQAARIKAAELRWNSDQNADDYRTIVNGQRRFHEAMLTELKEARRMLGECLPVVERHDAQSARIEELRRQVEGKEPRFVPEA